MAFKVLLSDWSTGQFGLISAGEKIDDAEPRYAALLASGAPFCAYDIAQDAVIAAYRNQAKVLPQGAHVDLTAAMEALGLITAPGEGNVVGAGPVTADTIPAQSGTTGKSIKGTLAAITAAGSINAPAGQSLSVGGVARAPLPTMVAVQAGTPIAAAIDSIIPVDATAGVATVNLPTAVGFAGHFVTVKSTAGGNDVVIDGNGAQTIDGAATKTILAAATGRDTTVTLVSNGANWLSL